MRRLSAFATGALFGTGLLISGMVDTTKVQGWLDIFGNWDPTLAFVLGGAVLPMIFIWRLAETRKTSVLGTVIPARAPVTLDANLIIGSLMFGVGWGLVGLCPGPAMASLVIGGWGGVLFLLAMVAGMLVAPPIRARLTQATA